MESDMMSGLGNISVRHRLLALAGLLAATLTANAALSQSSGAQEQTSKPMTSERVAWLKARCAQLVAFYDRYGVGRGENSDGPRNFTRIAASIECERTNYRQGIDIMAVLLVGKAFDVPKPGMTVVEPEDIEAPDITNPTRPWFWFQEAQGR
jgi:hypothetical protein